MSTDALSDVLSAVQLSGSVFFDVTAKSPWVAEAPRAAQIANGVMPGALDTTWGSPCGITAMSPSSSLTGSNAPSPTSDIQHVPRVTT